jgi:hypothetical protein
VAGKPLPLFMGALAVCGLGSLLGGLSGSPAGNQQRILQEISQVVNIEVPVRVFKSGKFVEDLTIRDFEERSSDVFTPFHEMAQSSGEFSDSSANPDWLFKTIKVRVKGKGYRVIHRLGYFSN